MVVKNNMSGVSDDLVKKALEQALASVSLEFDDIINILEKELEERKVLILRGIKNA